MSIERWDETTNSMQVRENGEFVRYTDHAAEIAALRERCGRLANEVMAWRDHDGSIHICHEVEGDVCPGCISYRAVTDAGEAVDAHNDLAPTEAKEKTDG